jgi:hypothetical protein
MIDLTNVPNFDDVSALLKERFAAMRTPARQWADLARLAIQGLPYDTYRLAELEARINSIRVELRRMVLAASEHFSEEQLQQLRKQAGMSKTAWRAAKDKRAVTIRHGFSLVIY